MSNLLFYGHNRPLEILENYIGIVVSSVASVGSSISLNQLDTRYYEDSTLTTPIMAPEDITVNIRIENWNGFDGVVNRSRTIDAGTNGVLGNSIIGTVPEGAPSQYTMRVFITNAQGAQETYTFDDTVYEVSVTIS